MAHGAIADHLSPSRRYDLLLALVQTHAQVLNAYAREAGGVPHELCQIASAMVLLCL